MFLRFSILALLSLCASCSSLQKEKLTELGFPLNQPIPVKFKVDWLQWGESKSGGPDDGELVLSEHNMSAKFPRLNYQFSLEIVRWEGNKFIATDERVAHPYYCEVTERQLICRHNKLPQVDYQATYTYTLLSQ
jgi:hypothetical protein